MRIQHYDGRAMILSKSEIPHLDKLSSYEWVSDFVKSQKIQSKINSLKEERSRIESMPISKSEYMLRLKKSQDDLKARLAERLRRFLADAALRQSAVADPLYNFEQRFERPHAIEYVPTWQEIEHATKNLPDDGIDDEARKRLLGKLDAQIAAQIADRPTTINATHHAFVDFWRDLQSQLAAPSGPRAIILENSPNIERDAWRLLGLDELVNDRLGVFPNPAN
jgi:hypothetical protein